MIMLLSDRLATIVDFEGLRDALGRLGSLETIIGDEARPDAVVCTPQDDRLKDLAREIGVPVLQLRESWTGRGLSIAEFAAGASDDADLRPVRLFEKFSDRLTAETEAAAADGVTVAASQAAGEEPAFPEDDAATWRALAQGREAVCARPCFATKLDLAHGGGAGSGAATAVRRNVRDRTRTALAVDYLYNTLPPDPAVVAEALFEAARARVVRRSARVSVIVTAFNYGDFVADAIASAKDQTVAPAEIIVVDDGSTDNTRDVVSGIADITVVEKENGGQASAFNAGFAAASGEVVIFLDGDDRLCREAVERAAGFDFAGVSRLQYLLETVDRNGRPTGLHPAGHRAAAGELRGALRADGVFWFMPTSGNAFPRPVLERLLPMPEAGFEIAADLYLVLGAALLGRAVHLPEVLGQYRVHGRNGYFHARAGAPYLKDKRRAQRTRAWQALLGALPGLAPEAAEVEADLSRLLRDEPRGVAPDPAEDPLGAAGKAHWPMVETGDRFGFLFPEAGASPLGAGWSDPGPLGAFPRESCAQIAVLLPLLEADWSMTVRYRAERPLRGVTFQLNGRLIDRMDLLADGTFSLRLPSFLLAPDAAGRRRALVTISLDKEIGAAFGLLDLRFDRLCGSGRSAPVLREGGWHGTGRGSRAACGLGRGWDWPDAEGVAPAAQTALISLSFPRAADRTLFLDWTGPGTPQVMCRGTRLDTAQGAVSGVTLVEMPASLGPVADLEIVFADADEASRLRALAWVSSGAGVPAIGSPMPAQDMLDASRGAAARVRMSPRGVAASEGGLRLRLRRPVLPEGGLVALDLVRARDPAGPLRCRVAVDGRWCEVTVGAWTRVPFAVTAGAEEVLVEVDPGEGAGDPILASVVFDVAPPATVGAGASGELAKVPELAPLWHAADGVLWLGAGEGDLVLPDLRCTTTSLAVGTLTLEAPLEQRLRVALVGEAGGVLSEADCPPGLGQVALAVPEGARRRLRLRVTAEHLVSADLVGAEPGRVLGGAIVSLAAV